MDRSDGLDFHVDNFFKSKALFSAGMKTSPETDGSLKSSSRCKKANTKAVTLLTSLKCPNQLRGVRGNANESINENKSIPTSIKRKN